MIVLKILCSVHNQDRSMLGNNLERTTPDDQVYLFLKVLSFKENGDWMC